MLAASRLTSHSHGPGIVSSKSFESNTSVRSGDAKRPKFERWASPLAWTMMSLRGVGGRSNAITGGADDVAPRSGQRVECHPGGGAQIEREGGGGHAAVTERQQILQPIRFL